jgi:cellulose synthase/poly-beta-1,6-N-acetylglucosamine synthase-like glycosyltransferase
MDGDDSRGQGKKAREERQPMGTKGPTGSEKPAASVIICSQLEQPLLAHTLAALRRQTVSNFETLLVVDKLKEEFLQAMMESAPRDFRILESRLRGLNAKRNHGMESARSDLFIFTDDDCVPDNRWVERILSASRRCGVVTGRALPLNRGFRLSTRTRTRARFYRSRFFDRVFGNDAGCGNNMAVSRTALERFGPFLPGIGVGSPAGAGGDLEYFFRVLIHPEGKIFYDPGAVIYHLQPHDFRRYLNKRREYFRGATFCCLRLHRKRPEAWVMALGRWMFAGASLAANALRLRRWQACRALADLRGAVEGLWVRVGP